MEFERRRGFQRNQDLERLLGEINNILGSVEHKIIDGYRMPKHPVILIVGAPRSGSTLLMQWLAYSGWFAYPTNLLSRFYGAPCIGAKIQQMMTDPRFNFRDELFDLNEQIAFVSHLGKTKGSLAPNEFWYFWRRFFPQKAFEYIDEHSIKAADSTKFTAELAGLEAVFGKPFAMKGHIANLQISYIAGILEKVLFIFVERHPFYNIQSLLEAREKYFGDRKAWYSFKSREYDRLQELDPIEQVAGQVYFANRAVEKGLGQINAVKGLRVSYEQFCAAPEGVFYQITEKLSQQGYRADWCYTGPEQFQSTNHIRLPREDSQRIIEAYKDFSGIEITP